MTAQFDDQFRYRDKTFAIAGISEGTLFDPALLEIEPRGTCTACYRGYLAIFALSGSRLVLDTLHVELAGDTEKTAVGPAINGVSLRTRWTICRSFSNSFIANWPLQNETASN